MRSVSMVRVAVLSALILSVIMWNVSMLSIVLLNVFILSVIMVSVILPNDAGPYQLHINAISFTREYYRGKYHCTINLLFDLF